MSQESSSSLALVCAILSAGMIAHDGVTWVASALGVLAALICFLMSYFEQKATKKPNIVFGASSRVTFVNATDDLAESFEEAYRWTPKK